MPDRDPLYRLAVVTLFPEMFAAIEQWGITGRAFQNGACQLTLHDPREEATDRHGTVDDRPYGGGPGMVMLAEPLSACLAAVRADSGLNRQRAPLVYFSPVGEVGRDSAATISAEAMVSSSPLAAATTTRAERSAPAAFNFRESVGDPETKRIPAASSSSRRGWVSSSPIIATF